MLLIQFLQEPTVIQMDTAAAAAEVGGTEDMAEVEAATGWPILGMT